jgi:hypothetical protein
MEIANTQFQNMRKHGGGDGVFVTWNVRVQNKQTTKPGTQWTNALQFVWVLLIIVCVSSVWAMDGMKWEDWNSLNKRERERRAQKTCKHLTRMVLVWRRKVLGF